MGIEMVYKRTFYDRYIKRLIDLIVSMIMIIVLSPIFLIIIILVKLKLGSPVIFKQERPGLNEKIFMMYKFRTMTDERDQREKLLSDEKRLTRFGKILRATSLDELPEIFNILKGNMALIGPRPLLVQYLPLYNEVQKRRHYVRPGITGYAQVNGRNSLTWEEKFEMDVYYIENINIFIDAKVFFKTIGTVLKRDGINSGTSVTMEGFKGTSNK